MAGKKKVDPIKQREKRAKIAAAIGGVLFLVVAAIEVPSIMSSLNKKPPAATKTTPASSGSVANSVPLPSVAATPSAPSSSGQLANTDVPPSPAGGQLVAFNVFQTKNPFTPQATTATTVASAPPAAGTPGGGGVPSTTTATTTTTPAATPPGVVPATVVPPSTTTVAAPPTVAISVNGVVSHVGMQGTFPTGAPVFRLVSFTSDSAQIGIVGGSYATGDATLTLQLGHAMTLENTTDQKTYKLELIATH